MVISVYFYSISLFSFESRIWALRIRNVLRTLLEALNLSSEAAEFRFLILKLLV